MLRRIPRAAAVCAAVAFANAVCWSIVSPPFEVTDEPDHFAYVQYLAETGHRPSVALQQYSPAEIVAMRDLGYYRVRAQSQHRTIGSLAEQRQLRDDLSAPISRIGKGGAGLASSEPPLYYALQVVPYELASGGTTLDQLALMRLLSALMAGATALLVFLFIREALPGAPWAWTVGGLGVALAPLLGYVSGSVNPDALLYAVSAGVFFCLARSFRRGLSARRAVALGLLIAAGLATKVNFVGLLPAVFVGLLILTWRTARTSKRSALRCLALASVIGLLPVLAYVLYNGVTGKPWLGAVTSSLSLSGRHGSLATEIGYIWQLYFPRLPGMHAAFHGLSTTRQLWFDGFVGRYGWSDTTFPAWAYDVALAAVALTVALALRAVVLNRRQLWRRSLELLTYALMVLGLMALVGAGDYVDSPRQAGGFVEARYFLPVIALWGATMTLSARGAGRRYGMAFGVCVVMLALAHDVTSQLLVVSRYYG